MNWWSLVWPLYHDLFEKNYYPGEDYGITVYADWFCSKVKHCAHFSKWLAESKPEPKPGIQKGP